MTNVESKVTGSKLTIEIDLSQEFGRSKSGKTITIASTGGFQAVKGQDGISMNINVCKKP